jgi:predicted  nucleic acid-binding Zn-ribbon protein
MSDSDITVDPNDKMNALLDELDDLKDDIALKKAEMKVTQTKFDRLARQFPEIAKAIKAARGIEEEADEDEDKPKRGRKPSAG